MHLHRIVYVLTAALTVGASPLAEGAAISPGFDLFANAPATFVIAGPPNVTFAPMQSHPIGPGNTDTIIQRTGSLADGATGTIPSQIIALSLESISPVNVSGSLFDVYLNINAIPSGQTNFPAGPPVYDTLPPSTGTTTVLTNGPNGGTFSSTFTVELDMILVAPGGNPSDPTQVVSHGGLPFGTANESLQGTWQTSSPCPPTYSGPGAGACQNGGFSPQSVTVTNGGLRLSPAVVPEPSTALLLSVGVMSLAVRSHRVRDTRTRHRPARDG
jgi:hypothetical protein